MFTNILKYKTYQTQNILNTKQIKNILKVQNFSNTRFIDNHRKNIVKFFFIRIFLFPYFYSRFIFFFMTS